ncbi:NAD(P)-dependent oxidoreductase [Methylobacterium oryzisoli]|uniref:NAD(P)-dependent oxidoreductase n=1 Tax=Methylobacterium oryzisoli TaxID=3385502 RepID=UPI0038916C44
MRALIGHTGFVGSNLREKGKYDAFFNSRNSSEMRGRHFDEIICSGARAVKWKANKDPEDDRAHINALIDNLRHVKTELFVLISTVDVYQHPLEVTEDDPADMTGLAYGVNRAILENFATQTFENCIIIRLPALYGRNLKKNALYDLQHGNMVEAIDSRNAFQWYDVRRLENDIETIKDSKLRLINITAEPVSMAVIGERYFPGVLRPGDEHKAVTRYDVRTKYASLLGGKRDYHFDQHQVIEGIGSYLEQKNK